MVSKSDSIHIGISLEETIIHASKAMLSRSSLLLLLREGEHLRRNVFLT